jgi:TPR repeat protein
VLCPACHEDNPDKNRFCGQCGAALSEPAHAQPRDETADTIGSPFSSQDVIAEARGGSNSGLSQREQRDSRPWAFEPLPKEVIDYDNGLPLLAEPGMDRRRQTPDSIRQAMQQAWGGAPVGAPEASSDPSDLIDVPMWSDAAPIANSEAPAHAAPDLESLWSEVSDFGSETGRQQAAPLSPVPPSLLAAPAKTETAPSPQHQTEPPNPAELPGTRHNRVGWDGKESAGAEDLSRFLDFTPAQQEQSGSLSGPSFLGLSGDAESIDSQLEPRARRWPRYLATALIAAIAVLTVMHGTALRETALRYARVGASYANSLRTGKAGSSTARTDLSGANAGPAASQTTPNFVVEQRPANPAQAAADAASAPAPKAAPEAQPAPPSQPLPQPQAAQAEAASPPAAASPAINPGNVPPSSTDVDRKRDAANGDSAKPTQTVEPKQSADSRPPAAKPQVAAPKPSALQSRKAGPVGGQGEYQQALATTNPEVARALLWRATALGNPDAPLRLADMYIYGQGVPQNCEQGLVLLCSAAQKANPRAQGKLGALYATGKCVSQDRVQAYRWLSLALNNNQGSEWMEKNREMVWREMSPAERSRVASPISTR